MNQRAPRRRRRPRHVTLAHGGAITSPPPTARTVSWRLGTHLLPHRRAATPAQRPALPVQPWKRRGPGVNTGVVAGGSSVPSRSCSYAPVPLRSYWHRRRGGLRLATRANVSLYSRRRRKPRRSLHQATPHHPPPPLPVPPRPPPRRRRRKRDEEEGTAWDLCERSRAGPHSVCIRHPGCTSAEVFGRTRSSRCARKKCNLETPQIATPLEGAWLVPS